MPALSVPEVPADGFEITISNLDHTSDLWGIFVYPSPTTNTPHLPSSHPIDFTLPLGCPTYTTNVT